MREAGRRVFSERSRQIFDAQDARSGTARVDAAVAACITAGSLMSLDSLFTIIPNYSRSAFGLSGSS